RSAEASGLLHHLFGVRAAGLAGRYGDGLPSYLSGLLLGHELRGGLAFDGACPGPVHLVAASGCSRRTRARSPRSGSRCSGIRRTWPRTACTPCGRAAPTRHAAPRPPPPADAMAHGPALPHGTAPPPARRRADASGYIPAPPA